jgi:hypothetical protein
MSRRRKIEKADYYRGVRMAPYDLVKEIAIATVGVLVAVLILSAVLSSPDIPSATIQAWAKADPVDFVTTAASELSSQTLIAQYGPPYTTGIGSVQSIGPIEPQVWAGVHVPVNAPLDFVLQPLSQATVGDQTLASALTTFNDASATQQGKWLAAYNQAVGSAALVDNQVTVPSGDYGPVPILMSRLLSLARSGGLDALLLTSGNFYQTDYSRPLLFLSDGGYFVGLAKAQDLTGSQWGMMNETGRYPGQAWIWLFTLWYQIPPFNTVSNTDLLVVVVMTLLSLGLLLVPFIPGLRDIPRWIPVHKLIWREHYKSMARRKASSAGRTGA